MRMRRPLLLGAACLGGLLLFLLLTLFCIPNRALQGVVERAAEQQGLTFRAASFGKALALGVTAREVELGGADGLLLRADRLTVRLRLLPLLAGKVVVSGVAAIGPGKAEVLRRRDGSRSNKDMAGVLAFVTFMLKELRERSGGLPFDNRNTIYSGTPGNDALNAGVKRYTADHRAAAHLKTYY